MLCKINKINFAGVYNSQKSEGPRHVAESYMCNRYMFTHLYEEYQLQIVVDTFILFSLSSHNNLSAAECFLH